MACCQHGESPCGGFVGVLPIELPLPAYEQVLKASHYFNLLDDCAAISVSERQQYILRVRKLAFMVAKAYFSSRRNAGFGQVPEAWRQRSEQIC